jgi:hypothetical protein
MRTLVNLDTAERVAKLEIRVERLEDIEQDVEQIKMLVERGKGAKWLVGITWIGIGFVLGWLEKALHFIPR